MNRFDASQLGGHPLSLNDLAFLQAALAEGINRHGDVITSFDIVNEAPITILRGVSKPVGANDAVGGGSA